MSATIDPMAGLLRRWLKRLAGVRWLSSALGLAGLAFGAAVLVALPAPAGAPRPAPSLAGPAGSDDQRAGAPSPAPPTIARPPGPRVILQIGHWRADQLPEEQAHLRENFGATFNGIAEQDLNQALARLVADELTARGMTVEIVPATVPPGASADAFVSIHCDFASDTAMEGYKVGVPWRASPASLALRDALHAAFAATGQPFHDGVNSTMRGYYAFNFLRYEHAVAPTTPAVIIEAGFMTNPDDYRRLTDGRAATALAIADGISAFLAGPSVSRAPPDLPLVAPLAPLEALSAPDPAAPPIAPVEQGALLWTYEERDGWYRVVLPPSWDYIGWVPAAAVAPLPDGAWRDRPPDGH